ncbi:MAG TPA: DNA polymerase I [Candidatus Saccharibacteria bacterium]|nr:DNA polymerase I [Candidatus Saccharibacteria bacterium]
MPTEVSTKSADKRKKLVVIDGKSVFYRGYYAMPNLSTKDGTPTGGVFGFASMALEIIKKLKPDYVAVAWDKPKTNIRKRLDIYPEYKAGRKPAPKDFYEQIPVLHELLDALGWPLYECDDYEADDIMGTLAVQARQADLDTLLVTSDLDMLQLVNGNVKVYALKKGLTNIELYSPESFKAKYGIDVHQFNDLKALKGDSSDNIPGVPGVGEKTAVQLLQDYKTLDGIYDNLHLIKDSVRRKLEAGKESAYMSHKLAEIWLDAPTPLDLAAMDGRNLKPSVLADVLTRLEFRSLARQLPDILPGLEAADLQVATGKKLKTGKLVQGLPDIKDHHVYVYSRAAGKHGARPELLAVSTDGINIYQVPLDKAADLLSQAHGLIGYDVKNTLQMLLELGCTELPKVHHDVLIGSFLLDSLRREQSLTDLAASDLGYEGSPLDNLAPDEVQAKLPDIMAVLKGLHEQQESALKDLPDIQKLAQEIEWPVIPVLARMEYRGILLDKPYLKLFSAQIEDTITDLQQQIYGMADQEFNIASPLQLADILFGTLQLPTQGIKKGKTGYSTAASELDKLRGLHPIIDMITQFREVTKLKNTYVDTLPEQTDGQGRVHTTFNLTIAQTGRLSSTDPNLQNIPTRTELGRHIRTAFVAGPGNKLVSADYSQFELRLAAVLARDEELIDMFNRGADIHTATAAQVYGRDPEDVTKDMRRAAKVINFGILYGMSPHGLAAAAGMNFGQAADFISKYKALRPRLFEYMDSLLTQAREQGYVATLLGRRRPMPDIKSSNFAVRGAAERAAINMPIQGTEADLMKLAMIKVDDLLRAQHNNCHQLLQIHDSILVECPAEVADRIADLLKTTMESVYNLPVRLDVDVTIGDNWGQL